MSTNSFQNPPLNIGENFSHGAAFNNNDSTGNLSAGSSSNSSSESLPVGRQSVDVASGSAVKSNSSKQNYHSEGNNAFNGPNTRSRNQEECANSQNSDAARVPDSPDYESFFHPGGGCSSRDRTQTRKMEFQTGSRILSEDVRCIRLTID